MDTATLKTYNWIANHRHRSTEVVFDVRRLGRGAQVGRVEVSPDLGDGCVYPHSAQPTGSREGG